MLIEDSDIHILALAQTIERILVASIQMLLDQQMLDMSYLRHYYYGHLLPIMKIDKKETQRKSVAVRGRPVRFEKQNNNAVLKKMAL